MHRRIAVVVTAAAALAMALAGATAGGVRAADQVTLTVGLMQDIDSPNVTAGYLVSSFELWNMQYAALTDKAADDFATTPGLAEKWTSSSDGLTWTYTLREGLKWSDGTSLTADDVAWTINTSRDQGWINHSSVTANLTATAKDDRTVEVVTSVPDPKLPTLDVYILPKHIWEKPAEGDITTYEALDGVGSGPFTLSQRNAGQDWTMVANPNFWRGKPSIDQVVFRVFSEGSAMVAALESGEIDFVHDVPSELFDGLKDKPDIKTVVGNQGGFNELAMNGMQGGLGDGHPALQDLTVRHAIAKAIDRAALLERVANGQGQLVGTIGVSPDPAWNPEIPADIRLDYDPDGAKKLLDDAGYVDADGDGVRDMPDGSRPLRFRYAELSDSDSAGPTRELITGWLKEIGIDTEVSTYDQTQLTDVIAAGEYDLFAWGWTPFVDPDPQLSYFTCAQLTTDIESVGYNDANWCDPAYDELYTKQNQELDRAKRIEIVHEMLLKFYSEGTYVVLYHSADTQAYRTDRFSGWLQQPKGTGPVLFSNTSPTWWNLQVVSGGGDGGGGLSPAVIAAIVGGVVAAIAASFAAMRSRRQRQDDEE
ncbi:MAG: hypothetical protein RI900_3080 [Actinomycetota bacterium]|jgi:peptide/nickel transport system substrate-binding protein